MRRIFTIACTLFPTLLILLLYSGCKPQLAGPAPSAGYLNLFRYVAIGDGFTAGVTNGSIEPYSFAGLYAEGQQYSFPKLLADQFLFTKLIEFEQPVLPGDGSGYIRIESMQPTSCPSESQIPVLTIVNPEAGWKNAYASQKLINNLGIPQLKASDVFQDSIIEANPFFNRINPSGVSYISMIRDSRPGFFTLWLGMTDFLAYAMKGAEYYGSHPADADQFAQSLDYVLDGILLTSPQAKGVIGNIPDITLFPYFHTVPYQFVNKDKCKGTFLPIYITTSTGVRVATANDQILLPAKDKIGIVYGQGTSFGLIPENPVPGHWVLDKEEIALIRNLIEAYNQKISEKVSSLNGSMDNPAFVIADIHYLIYQLSHSYTEDGLEVSNDYLSGGIFSLDGIYFTPRGNAVIANSFIRTINSFSSFGASIPPINITDYPGVVFP